MSKELKQRFWDLLNDVEDYVSQGFKRKHDPLARKKQSGGREIQESLKDGTEKEVLLKKLNDKISVCKKCPLHETRNSTVPGMGVMNPEVMVIGEGPGGDEDKQGLPFVGKAGQFLDKWLDAIDLSRFSNVYIGNIVKCRPPNNRDPKPNEVEQCMPYLEQQIFYIKPKAILTLGRIATQVLLNNAAGIGKQRGRVHLFKGIPLIATYHPSAVLRNAELKRQVWEDLKLLRKTLDE